jgi:sulfoxide reductase heme-binding subunit YedZ
MAAAASSQLLWYSTRTTGIVALVLLTASVVIGVLTTLRYGNEQWPRFAIQSVHRKVSLLAVVFLGLHVVTTVSDSFAPIGWLSVVVPFTSAYRRLWLGLGTAALDLLAAVTISSLLRQRINPRTWRALHWLAYASWPLAVVHSLGTGTDPRLRWVLLLVAACVVSVLGVLTWRLATGWPAHAGARVAAGATSVVAVIALVGWTATGPLRPGWAARAGTPKALLAGSRSPLAGSHPSGTGGSAAPPTTTTTPSRAGGLPAPPFQAPLTGTISQQSQRDGSLKVTIAARTSGNLAAAVQIVIIGTSDGQGGVIMQQSQATFGPSSAPSEYQGHIVRLEGTRIELSMTDAAGSPLVLRVDVNITGSQVSGQLASISASSLATGGGDDGN